MRGRGRGGEWKERGKRGKGGIGEMGEGRVAYERKGERWRSSVSVHALTPSHPHTLTPSHSIS